MIERITRTNAGLLSRSVAAAAIAVLLGIAAPAFTQTAEAESAVEGQAGAPESAAPADTPSASPQDAFDKARVAYNDRNWSVFVDTVSPGRRDELIGQFAVTFATIAQQPEADPRVAELVERHVPKDLDPMDLLMASEDTQAELIRLARRMRDGKGFFAEAISLAFVLEFGPEADTVKLTELSDVVIDEPGTSAAGKVTVETPDGPREDTWTFERYEGGWYLSMKQ
ncbi:MAG: hypothetical protein AAGL98_02905 [Planctomycetota bacterium]